MSDIKNCIDPGKRYDFVLLFDVTDGNPNGDPDAGNMPRTDPETMHGLVTDVCLKRKIRNFVALTKDKEEGYGIYVNDQGIALNTLHQEAYDDAKIKSTGSKQTRKDVESVRERMCRRFFDVRTFGAVMTTGVNAGQVRGPVQLTFARSVDPVIPVDVTITRVAITKPSDAEVVVTETDGGSQTSGKATEMGRKSMIPYGLFRAHGFFTAPFAKQTGVTSEDLELFWTALINMWDLDHSASRGQMSCRGLYVFAHENALGNAPSHKLFEKIDAKFQPTEETVVPRRFSDYKVQVNDADLPSGVTLIRLTEG
ncbi:MAG: type CRISPR-associated protein Cas7/Csd2 [Capsulimonas sp.]|nr:type CRISPR-associated protein Cas7/Csd2 [Capsulimonas sp.]